MHQDIELAVLNCLYIDNDNSVCKIQDIDPKYFIYNQATFLKLKTIKAKYSYVDMVICIQNGLRGEELTLISGGLNICLGLSRWASYLYQLKESWIKHTLRSEIENESVNLERITELIKEKPNLSNYTLFDIQTDMAKYIQHLENNMSSDNVTKYNWGFNKFNNNIGKIRSGQLVTIGGFTSTGKTTLTINLIYNLALNNHKILYLTSEQTPEDLTDILMSLRTGVLLTNILEGTLSNEECRLVLQGAEDIKRLPIKFILFPRFNVKDINNLIDIHNPDILIVDFLQKFITPPGNKSTAMYYSDVVTEIKNIALERKKAAFLLSQYSRSYEDRGMGEPYMSDLKESGGIETNSDRVLLIWETMRAEENRAITIKVAKNKTGSTGNFNMTFWNKIARFEENAI